MGGKLTQDEVAKTVDFCLNNAFRKTSPEERKRVLDKLAAINGSTSSNSDSKVDLESLTEEELNILNHIRAKQMMHVEDSFNIDNFASDALLGFAPNLKRGKLGLVEKTTKNDLSKLDGLVIDLLVPVEESEPITAAA